MHEKIGLGIVTYKRPDFLKQVLESIEGCLLDEIVVVNDSEPYNYEIPHHVIQHTENKGVGISKNDALRYLQAKKCDHYFLMEDDIIVKDKQVFNEYIKASKLTGIQHFNFSQHGVVNKTAHNQPVIRARIEYPKYSLPLFRYCIGAVSYYSRQCLEKVGLMDERFYNAAEHVDHTYRATLEGMHPPYWWFADINNSEQFLSEIIWSISTSTISSNSNHSNVVKDADKIFFEKHNAHPLTIPETSQEELGKSLKSIYKQFVH